MKTVQEVGLPRRERDGLRCTELPRSPIYSAKDCLQCGWRLAGLWDRTLPTSPACSAPPITHTLHLCFVCGSIGERRIRVNPVLLSNSEFTAHHIQKCFYSIILYLHVHVCYYALSSGIHINFNLLLKGVCCRRATPFSLR